jgi:hypothetical protein
MYICVYEGGICIYVYMYVCIYVCRVRGSPAPLLVGGGNPSRPSAALHIEREGLIGRFHIQREGLIGRFHIQREGLIGRCHIQREGLIGRCRIQREDFYR